MEAKAVYLQQRDMVLLKAVSHCLEIALLRKEKKAEMVEKLKQLRENHASRKRKRMKTTTYEKLNFING